MYLKKSCLVAEENKSKRISKIKFSYATIYPREEFTSLAHFYDHQPMIYTSWKLSQRPHPNSAYAQRKCLDGGQSRFQSLIA